MYLCAVLGENTSSTRTGTLPVLFAALSLTPKDKAVLKERAVITSKQPALFSTQWRTISNKDHHSRGRPLQVCDLCWWRERGREARKEHGSPGRQGWLYTYFSGWAGAYGLPTLSLGFLTYVNERAGGTRSPTALGSICSLLSYGLYGENNTQPPKAGWMSDYSPYHPPCATPFHWHSIWQFTKCCHLDDLINFIYWLISSKNLKQSIKIKLSALPKCHDKDSRIKQEW